MADGIQAPLLDSRQRGGHEYDVQTTDRGRAAARVVTSVLRDGELVVTRDVPYLPNSPEDYVRNMMMLHHHDVLSDLEAGKLDAEIEASVSGIPSATGTELPAARPRRALNSNPEQLSSSSVVVTYVPPRGGSLPAYVMALPEPRAFLDLYYTRNNQHGVMVETGDFTDLGKDVDLRIRILNPRERHFNLAATVTWKRPRGTATLKPGIGVNIRKEFSAALETLVETALGIQDPSADRQHPRAPCQYAARLGTSEGTLPVELLNLSRGGACVRTGIALPPGTDVTLTFDAGMFFRVKMRSRVQWSTPEPSTAGLMFMEDVPGRLSKLVDKLLQTAGPLP